MKRRIFLGTGIAVAAALVGLGVGLLVHRGAHSALLVRSTWTKHDSGFDYAVTAGALARDTGRGFVLFQVKGRRPQLFTTPEGAGALRLTSATTSEWILKSQSGAVAVVENESQGGDVPSVSFTYFGKRLDPKQLGAIASHGIAVPVRYGRPAGKDLLPRYKAVLLVGRSGQPGAPGEWTVDGYLSGFALPLATDRTHELERPLLGADHRLYRIDARLRRLVDVGAGAREAVSAPGYQAGCSRWPGRSGASYTACPGSLVQNANGTTSTLLRRTPAPPNMHPGWGLASPSADGRWLLLEDETESCGTATSAYVLPATGGNLIPVLQDSASTQALGWLPGETDTALVTVRGEGCDATPPSGIYTAHPYLDSATESVATQLVIQARAQDATTWG